MKKRSLLLWGALFLALGASGQAVNLLNFRNIDGKFNNLQNPTWGAAGSRLLRVSGTAFADGFSSLAGADRPNARVISNAVFTQEGFMPAPQGLSDYMWVWGQFLDHDFGLTPDNQETLFIPVPQGDDYFDPFGTGQVVIPLHRNLFDPTTGNGPGNPRQHVNIISSYIDASFVYGDNYGRAAWLRTFQGGKLKVSAGNYLPYNTVNGEIDGEIDPHAPPMGNPVGLFTKFFVAGDERANENPLLAGLHTLFVREHNRMCDELALKHPNWSDEQLYQHARKFVGGFVQAITYREWLPQLGVTIPPYTGYKSNVNATLANEFTAAAFRLGHTLLNGTLLRLDNNGEVIPEGNMLLRDAFFNPQAIVATPGGLDPFFRGMAVQTMQQFDARIVDDIRNFLFGPPGAGGLDLAAINIMRGRERGLPDFNTIRAAYGLPPYMHLAQMNSSAAMVNTLHTLYGNVNNIDPWVGFLAEQTTDPNSVLGPTLQRILQVQFTALRDGDRFYYENDPILTLDEKERIKNTTLQQIILRNSGLTMLQSNVFRAIPYDDICDNMFVKISGSVRNVQNQPQPGVQVLLTLDGGPETLMSDAQGRYDFGHVSGCHVHGLALQRNDPAVLGVTTLDVLMVQRHILNAEPLDSPYKLLAADVNRSGNISTVDVIEMRRVILGAADAFSSNTIWRFIPASHVFADPANPFGDNIAEPPMTFSIMSLNYEEDFIAIKMGDVNGSSAQSLTEPLVEARSEPRDLVFHVQDRIFRRGETVGVTLNAADLTAYAGFQMELNYGKNLALVELVADGLPGFDGSNYHIVSGKGLITMSWHAPQHQTASSKASITMRYTALSDGRLSEALFTGYSTTPAEAYTRDIKQHALRLAFVQPGESLNGFSLYQNRPNPMREVTSIPFHLPQSGFARLTVHDVAGRVIYTAEQHLDGGYHEWTLNRSQLKASGVVFYRVESAQGALTRKMLLLD